MDGLAQPFNSAMRPGGTETETRKGLWNSGYGHFSSDFSIKFILNLAELEDPSNARSQR